MSYVAGMFTMRANRRNTVIVEGDDIVRGDW